MIVEDEELELEFLKSIVKEMLEPNDTVVTCHSGMQAVNLAKRYRPDFLIMDILLPELDGLQALTAIREFLPQARVLILSAYSDFSYAQTAIRLKVRDYLLKPVKPAIFRQAFSDLMLSEGWGCEVSQQLQPGNQAMANSVIEKSLHYINSNFKQKLSLQEVAAAVFVNPQHFSRIFKKELGISCIEYVNKLKIEYACKLLEQTNYPAYRVSYECGFSDPSYFNKVFVQQMQMTPKAYRRQCLYNKDK